MTELELMALKEEQLVASRALQAGAPIESVASINYHMGFHQGLLHAEKVMLEAARKARQRDAED